MKIVQCAGKKHKRKLTLMKGSGESLDDYLQINEIQPGLSDAPLEFKNSEAAQNNLQVTNIKQEAPEEPSPMDTTAPQTTVMSSGTQGSQDIIRQLEASLHQKKDLQGQVRTVYRCNLCGLDNIQTSDRFIQVSWSLQNHIHF